MGEHENMVGLGAGDCQWNNYTECDAAGMDCEPGGLGVAGVGAGGVGDGVDGVCLASVGAGDVGDGVDGVAVAGDGGRAGLGGRFD